MSTQTRSLEAVKKLPARPEHCFPPCSAALHYPLSIRHALNLRTRRSSSDSADCPSGHFSSSSGCPMVLEFATRKKFFRPLAIREKGFFHSFSRSGGFMSSRSASELLLTQKTELPRLTTVCSGDPDTTRHRRYEIKATGDGQKSLGVFPLRVTCYVFTVPGTIGYYKC